MSRKEAELSLIKWRIVTQVALIGILVPIVMEGILNVVVNVPKILNIHSTGAIEVRMLGPTVLAISGSFLIIFAIAYIRMLVLRRLR